MSKPPAEKFIISDLFGLCYFINKKIFTYFYVQQGLLRDMSVSEINASQDSSYIGAECCLGPF